MTDVVLATDVVAAGCVVVLVTVGVLAGAAAVCVLDVVASVTVPDWLGAVALLTFAAAVEAALLAPLAALEAAPLVDPDPHALSCAAATPSASAPRTSGTRVAEMIPVAVRVIATSPRSPNETDHAYSCWTSSCSAYLPVGGEKQMAIDVRHPGRVWATNAMVRASVRGRARTTLAPRVQPHRHTNAATPARPPRGRDNRPSDGPTHSTLCRA